MLYAAKILKLNLSRVLDEVGHERNGKISCPNQEGQMLLLI